MIAMMDIRGGAQQRCPRKGAANSGGAQAQRGREVVAAVAVAVAAEAAAAVVVVVLGVLKTALISRQRGLDCLG